MGTLTCTSPAPYWSRRLPALHHHRRFRADLSLPSNHPSNVRDKRKVVVVGAGWAGLASAHHLTNEGYEVTLLEAASAPTEEVGLRGFWYPYRNIFALVEELGLQPFTKWTKAAYYSSKGLSVELPIFQDQFRLPAPLGVLAYPKFTNLQFTDRLTSIPLVTPVIDFDNSDTAWKKYDSLTSRELFKKHGCSKQLYQEVFEPAVQAALLAPPEQCSAAATLAMLCYYVFSHQQDFDVLFCRGDVGEQIFSPWLKILESKGLRFLGNRLPAYFTINEETGCISGVGCGGETYSADAFVLALGVSTLQSIVASSSLLRSRKEFLDVLHLSSIDVVSARLWFDRKVRVPKAANVCASLDGSMGWAFFDLTTMCDEYNDGASVLEIDFYNASNLLPLEDEQIVECALEYLTNCIGDLKPAVVTRNAIARFPKSSTHFFPGSYKYMMRGSTSFPNLFMAGDWIVNRHGSWLKEKTFVTGLEAANRVVDYLGEGNFAKILPVENEEPHIETLRMLKRRADEIRTQLPFVEFFL